MFKMTKKKQALKMKEILPRFVIIWFSLSSSKLNCTHCYLFTRVHLLVSSLCQSPKPMFALSFEWFCRS